MGKGAIRWSTEQHDAFEARKRTAKAIIAPVPETTVEKKKPKYGNSKVEINGEKYDSLGEYHRHERLKQMERMGLIHDLKRNVKFVLVPAVKLYGEHRTKPAMRYTADFTYEKNGALVAEDFKCKATKTTAYRMRKHLMKAFHNIDILETSR